MTFRFESAGSCHPETENTGHVMLDEAIALCQLNYDTLEQTSSFRRTAVVEVWPNSSKEHMVSTGYTLFNLIALFECTRI